MLFHIPLSPPSLFFSPLALRELTLGPQLCAVIPQHPDADDACDGEPAENAAATPDAQVHVHRVCEDDAAGGEGGARQVVGGEEGGGVLLRMLAR